MKSGAMFYGIRLLVLALSVLLAGAGLCHAADGDKSTQSETTDDQLQSESASPAGPIKTEKIDQAGEKVGRSIDKVSAVAAKHIGAWINDTAYKDISWLKLIFCMLLIAVLVVLERVVRWAIQRRIDTIPRVTGEISWLRLFLTAIAKPLSLFLWIYGIYAALSPLYGHFQSPDGSNTVLSVFKRSADIGGTVALFWFLYQLVALLDARLVKWISSAGSAIDDMLIPLVGKTLRVFISVIGAIMILQNLTGVQIGPLLASLGIGGLAIAFAAKDSIANFFGTLTILFDKPFQVGERIVIDGYDGSVESVGFRSTRVRLLNGHLVTIPNEKVVNSTIENIGKRPYIRWLTNIGITYDTPPDKAAEAVTILRDILNDHDGSDPEFPPRVYFNGFNDWSLNITMIVWYHPAEYWPFQAWLQETCLEIMRRFESAGIDFAFPSRTIYMANDDTRQLKLQLIKGEMTPDTAST